MSLEQDIRTEIENIKKLKMEVGKINIHLSILEQRCKDSKEESYQRGFDDAHRISEEEYQRGLNDAWEAARKIVGDTDLGGIELSILGEIFGTRGYDRIMQENTAQEAIEKLKAYEEKQADRIKVRDEVIWTCDENTAIVVTSVYTVEGMEWCDGLTKDGKAYSILTKNARKTGRRFDIQSILEAMKK